MSSFQPAARNSGPLAQPRENTLSADQTGSVRSFYRVGSVLTAAPSHTAQPSSEKAIGRAVQHPAVSELRGRALAILMMTLESCTTGPPLSSSAHRHRCLSGLWTHSLTLRIPASQSGQALMQQFRLSLLPSLQRHTAHSTRATQIRSFGSLLL